jgi:hypothetical protein
MTAYAEYFVCNGNYSTFQCHVKKILEKKKGGE